MARRLALVVGIADYAEASMVLQNPVNDAELIAAALKERGFELIFSLNSDLDTLVCDIEKFRERIEFFTASDNKVFSVVFFAGHAVELNGNGFILPADFPEDVRPSALRLCGLSTTHLIDAMSVGLGPKVLILDACRVSINDWTVQDTISFAELIEEQRITYTRAATTSDLVIAYSTSAGAEALDGKNSNSVYSEKLAKGLLKHTSTVSEMLTAVGQSVIEESKTRQRPWYLSNLSSPIFISDLPRFRQTFSSPVFRSVDDRSRIHYRTMDDTVVLHDENTILSNDDFETHPLIKTQGIKAVALKDEHIFYVTNDNVLHVNFSDNNRSPLSIKIDCPHTFGIAVSPSNNHIAVFGLEVTQIFKLSKKKLEFALELRDKKRLGFYSALFTSESTVYVCAANGQVSRLDFSSSSMVESKLQDKHHSPVYDLHAFNARGVLVTTSSSGKIHFYDMKGSDSPTTLNIGTFGHNKYGIYSRLRVSGTPSGIALEMAEDPEHHGWTDYNVRAPTNDLLCCCALGQDQNILAVGSGEGFIYLIDMRDRTVFQTLDAGGGRGVKLQWICANSANKLFALAADGVFTKFEGISPKY